jgi:hypothetical protein
MDNGRIGFLSTFCEYTILNATRSKRWNGKYDALPADYLNEVLTKMHDYGDRVQFSLVSSGPQPSYQVMNALGKKMAFDRNHHLLSPDSDEFVGANASPIFSLDQIKAMLSGVGKGSTSKTRTARVARAPGTTRSSAAKLDEQFAAQRYEYFKNNRQTLPPTIADYSAEITGLMKAGKSVEEAFDEVLKKHY